MPWQSNHPEPRLVQVLARAGEDLGEGPRQNKNCSRKGSAYGRLQKLAGRD